MKIIFLDHGSFPDWASFPEETKTWTMFEETPVDKIIERAAGYDIVVTNKVVLTANILQNLPELKMIAITATGTNNVDLSACKELGISVANVSGYAAGTVAEHCLAQIFSLRRNLFSYKASMEKGQWGDSPHFCHFAAPISDIQGTTTYLIGAGAIGKKLAEKCVALGMNVLFADDRKIREPGYTSVNDALQIADQIVICCPLNNQTKNLINIEKFKLMKPDAILINNSRGGIVNEEDLVYAIQHKLIAGAAMDVSYKEPLPSSSVLYSIIGKNNFLLTPHVAWGSNGAIQNLISDVMMNIETFKSGGGSHFIVPPKNSGLR